MQIWICKSLNSSGTCFQFIFIRSCTKMPTLCVTGKLEWMSHSSMRTYSHKLRKFPSKENNNRKINRRQRGYGFKFNTDTKVLHLYGLATLNWPIFFPSLIFFGLYSNMQMWSHCFPILIMLIIIGFVWVWILSERISDSERKSVSSVWPNG